MIKLERTCGMGFPEKPTRKEIEYVETSMELAKEIDFIENAYRLRLDPDSNKNLNEKMYLFKKIFGYENLRTAKGFVLIGKCPEANCLAAFRSTYNSSMRKVQKAFPHFKEVLQSKS